MSDTVITSDLDLWDRQTHETAKQFHAFGHYLDMPTARRAIDMAYHLHHTDCLKEPAGQKGAKGGQKTGKNSRNGRRRGSGCSG